MAPSVQKIREALGTGSNTTIAEHLKVWRDDYANKTIHHLPSTLPKELIASMEILWQTAMEQAENQLATYKKSLKGERETQLQTLGEAEKNLTRLNQMVSEQQLKTEKLIEEKQTLTAELAIIKDRLEKKDELIAMEKNQYEARLQRVYQEKDAIVATVQELQKDALMLREKLILQVDENQKQLAKERALQEQSENRWLNLIDQSKTEVKELRKKMESDYQAREKVVTQLKDQLNEMRRNHYEKDAQLKIAIEQMNQFKNENKLVNSEMSEAKSIISKLESERKLKKSAVLTNMKNKMRVSA